MKAATLLLALCAAAAIAHANEGELGIETTHLPEHCDFKAQHGDQVHVHYTGKLDDGSVFDSSVERGEPITFMLGDGEVIAGWDQGIDGMCIGEKRKLTIPPELGYGETGYPPIIPGNAVLHFDVELVHVTGPDEVAHTAHGDEDEDQGQWAGQEMEGFDFENMDFAAADEEAFEGNVFEDN